MGSLSEKCVCLGGDAGTATDTEKRSAYQQYVIRFDEGGVKGVFAGTNKDDKPVFRAMSYREWLFCGIVEGMVNDGVRGWTDDQIVSYVYSHKGSGLEPHVKAWADQCVRNECPLQRIAERVKERLNG